MGGGDNNAVIDHADSMGNGARYGGGDVQWMTAGRGVQHSEMFPLTRTDAPNHLKLFQLWLNLPAKDKFTDPAFVMHWAESVGHAVDDAAGSSVTVWAGEYAGVKGQAPPPASWGANPDNDLAIFHIVLKPRIGAVTLAPAKIGAAANRRLYFFEGGAGVTVGGQAVQAKHGYDLDPTQSAELRNAGDDTAEFLLLQGRPIAEPVVSHGPFVMNTQAQIREAFSDFAETQFGGWPWPTDAHVYPRDKGRFTLVNGVESTPPKL